MGNPVYAARRFTLDSLKFCIVFPGMSKSNFVISVANQQVRINDLTQ